jgi:CubicO group peptidase (beta-lactamase class C family)
MKTKHFQLQLLLCLIYLIFPAQKTLCQQTSFPISTPEEQGLNGTALKKVVQDIPGNSGTAKIDSLLVVRNGYLILEEYFNGYTRKGTHTQQSVSKSFTSAAIGIAIDKKIIKGVTQNILNFFPEVKYIKNLDERKRKIKLIDLLTMRSGTDYHERGPDSPHFQLNRLPGGWDLFYLNRPMINEPGTTFLYDSGGVILMSKILKNLTGMHADKFMEKYLFAPLGIEQAFWFKNSEGHPHTGGGLSIRPLDMAKFGFLFLRKGKWGGRQVISEKWVKESFKMRVNFNKSRGPFDVGYGYLWWILRPAPKSNNYIYAAKGFMGQYIFLIPEYDMVVVFTGSSRTGSGMRKPIELLYQRLLPAAKTLKKSGHKSPKS